MGNTESTSDENAASTTSSSSNNWSSFQAGNNKESNFRSQLLTEPLASAAAALAPPGQLLVESGQLLVESGHKPGLIQPSSSTSPPTHSSSSSSNRDTSPASASSTTSSTSSITQPGATTEERIKLGQQQLLYPDNNLVSSPSPSPIINQPPAAANQGSNPQGSTVAEGTNTTNNQSLAFQPLSNINTLSNTTSPSPSPSQTMTSSKPSTDVITTGMFITQQRGNFSDRYRGLKILGKGSFGEVVLCQDRSTGAELAVKVVSKRNLKKGADTSSLLREVELLKELDHPNIMKLFEFFEDSGYFYLVSEAYTGGELFDAIIAQKKFNEVDAARIIFQVLSGITYMHKHKIVHRDLKPENLLLENKKKDALIKIIDFGLSTHFETQAGTKMKDKIGTAYYIAPEVLHGTYDEKCDVWSAGVILYILLSGCPPFFGNTEYDILKRVETGKFTFSLPQWKKISEPAKDLIRRMLFYVPAMRISSQQCLEHEWIQTICTSKVSDLKIDLPSLEQSMLNMRQFQSTQKLAKAALLYMGSKLTTAEETSALTRIFRSLDKNGDGQLDRAELLGGYKELMKMKGVDVTTLDAQAIENEIDQVLEMVDFDKNGFLDYSEFVTVAMDRKTLLSKERLKRAFEMFDTDRSGKISRDEIAKIFVTASLTGDELEALMSDIDVNQDGEIDFDEFVQMIYQLELTGGVKK